MGESGRIMIGLSLLAAALCAGSLWFLGVERARAACNVEGIGEVTIGISPTHLYVCLGGTATGTVSVTGVYSSVSIPVTFETNSYGSGNVTVSPSPLLLPRSPSSSNYTVYGVTGSSVTGDTEIGLNPGFPTEFLMN